jgi:hypothetical protein
MPAGNENPATQAGSSGVSARVKARRLHQPKAERVIVTSE